MGSLRKMFTMFVQAIVMALVLHLVQSDVFSAITHLEKVLHVEKDLAKELRLYIQEEHQRLEKLTRVAEDYEKHSTHALKDTIQHLANPVNAFLLVKRFTADFQQVEKLIQTSASGELLYRIGMHQPQLPTSDDLHGAGNALLRLQDTYKLPTEKVARGDLQGVKGSPHLTAEACFELGKIAYSAGDHYHTVLWMSEALKILETEVNKTVDKATILDYLSYSTYMQGNIHHALNMTKDWLELDPTHSRAQNNLHFFEKIAMDELPGEQNAGVPKLRNERHLDEYRQSEEFNTYESLCRGEEIIPNPHAHRLVCRLTHKNNPIFYLNPLREEDLYQEPWIAFYHDLLTDAEIRVIEEIAGPRLQRATVHNPQTGKLETSYYRVSKSAWLSGHQHPLLARIDKKVEGLTNLDLETAEPLQVLNYGIGGHYEPHFDFGRENELASFGPQIGNRIATFIAYLSDVPAGGYTVFTSLGAKVVPEKGGAAFWFNMLRNGEGDYRTRHAACPVLTGSKWVANKWIHERGQEFRYSCSLDPKE